MSDWQPIESAPTDGTMVDLRRVDARGESIYHRCHWGLCDRGWSVMGIFDWIMAPEGWRPTHWMTPAPATLDTDE